MELTKHHTKADYGPVYRQHSPDPERCAGRVYHFGAFFVQCRHKRHPDTLDGAFCKAHCPERKKARQEKRNAARRAEAAGRRAYYEKEANRRKLKDEAAQLLADAVAGNISLSSADVRQWWSKWRALK